MHYVTKFNINGVETMQVACVPLHGKPNAATEGAVGVFGIDLDSPTYDLYWCVDVTGSIYTWKPCSALGLTAKVESLEELIMDTLNEYQDSTARVDELDAEVTEFMRNADERIDKIESETSEFVEESTERMDKMETDVSDFIGESTEKINGLETEVSDYSERIGTLESDVADLLYAQNPLSITSFSVTPLSLEKGITVNSASLTWSLNKTPATLFADGIQLPLEKDGSYALGSETDDDEKLGITADHTWTLAATDERGKSVAKKATLTFYNGVYYGVSEVPATYDSAFIIALGKSGKKTLRSSKLTSFTDNAGEGEYIYYCLPTSMGTCSFKVGGFDGGFELVSTLTYTNEHGHEEEYYIYRSSNAALGKTTVEVK